MKLKNRVLMVAVTVEHGDGPRLKCALHGYNDILFVGAGEELLLRLGGGVKYSLKYRLCLRDQKGVLCLAGSHLNATGHEIVSTMLTQSTRDFLKRNAN